MPTGGSAPAFDVQGIDALHRRCVEAGLQVVISDPTSGKHGLRTFTVADVEGSRITFQEPQASPG